LEGRAFSTTLTSTFPHRCSLLLVSYEEGTNVLVSTSTQYSLSPSWDWCWNFKFFSLTLSKHWDNAEETNPSAPTIITWEKKRKKRNQEIYLPCPPTYAGFSFFFVIKTI
jgi:hypothetical protein